MKNVISITAVLAALALGSSAFAQTDVSVGGEATSSHEVQIRIPSFVAIRAIGTAADPYVEFDLTSGDGLADYRTALESALDSASPTPTPVAATAGSTLTKVEGWTNDVDGYTVDIGISGTGGSGITADDILFNEGTLTTAQTVTSSDSKTWSAIATPSDFTLQIDGDEDPTGTEPVTFTITYTIAAQ